MKASIQSAVNNLALAIRDSGKVMEVPSFTLHKMCYAYINNDWVTVVASCFTLVVTIISITTQGLRA